MHEPPPSDAQHRWAELANIVGIDHLGQVWVRPLDSMQREVAWVCSALDSSVLERAASQNELALIQRVAPKNTPVICALVRPRITKKHQVAQPHIDDEGVLHAEGLSLGNGRAKLTVRQNTLHIEADAIVSFARGRHRIVGGTIEIG